MVALEMPRELFSRPVMKQVSSVLRQYYTKMNLLERCIYSNSDKCCGTICKGFQFHGFSSVRYGVCWSCHRSRHGVHFKKFLYRVQRTHNLIDKTYACLVCIVFGFQNQKLPEFPWLSLPTQFSCHFKAKNRECHGYRFSVATAVLR
jgi:hypothetical protein